MPRLLIIDDDKDFLKVLESLLVKLGFDILTFNEWEYASEALKHSQPQLILLDIFLPGIDGLAICDKLKSSPHTQGYSNTYSLRLPGICRTGYIRFWCYRFYGKAF
jgi:CheY-like chemotaxis protein